VDKACEQKKLEARKMLAVGSDESHQSGARGVGQTGDVATFFLT
jgi:hypothetical protein